MKDHHNQHITRNGRGGGKGQNGNAQMFAP